MVVTREDVTMIDRWIATTTDGLYVTTAASRDDAGMIVVDTVLT